MAANQSAAQTIVKQNERPEPDRVLQDIADYVHNYQIDSPLAVRAPFPDELVVNWVSHWWGFCADPGWGSGKPHACA